jgi:hypothetical protein
LFKICVTSVAPPLPATLPALAVETIMQQASAVITALRWVVEIMCISFLAACYPQAAGLNKWLKTG